MTLAPALNGVGPVDDRARLPDVGEVRHGASRRRDCAPALGDCGVHCGEHPPGSLHFALAWAEARVHQRDNVRIKAKGPPQAHAPSHRGVSRCERAHPLSDGPMRLYAKRPSSYDDRPPVVRGKVSSCAAVRPDVA